MSGPTRVHSGDGVRNKALFEKFAAEQETWNQRVGIDLTYESLDGRRACRIAAHHAPADLLSLSPTQREELTTWLTPAFLAMYDALDGPLRSMAREVRTATVATFQDGAPPALNNEGADLPA
ncbi:MAG: DUF4268 domain-containing protein [Nocardioidaceae bacterium]